MTNKEIQRALQSQGYASGGTWGGPQRVTYYAPDGSVREAIPSHLTDGKGIRYDRMILQGYSLSPPENPKPHCAGCGRWHDTQEEVNACIKKRKTDEKRWEKKAHKDVSKGQDKEIQGLRKEVSELKKLMEQLIKKETKDER